MEGSLKRGFDGSVSASMQKGVRADSAAMLLVLSASNKSLFAENVRYAGPEPGVVSGDVALWLRTATSLAERD